MRPALLLILLALIQSPPAHAEVYRCQIGKPSYCFKYGGNLCQQWNRAPNAAAACEKWTAACLDCHTAIPDCLGNKRPPSTAPSCKRCEARWLACMKKIDARHWPNRIDGR